MQSTDAVPASSKLHANSRKTTCPRGHLLEPPNLVASQAVKGFRECLACSLGRNRARNRGIPFDQEIADRLYLHVLSGRPRQAIADYMAERTRLGSPPDHKPGLGPCHEWTGTILVSGYGVIGLRSHHKMLAHRVAYELGIGPIPEGLLLDHLRRNRACVNPAHLDPVTNAENLRRGFGHRLRNGMAKTCPHGHEYTVENTYTNPKTGYIRCRQCHRERERARSVEWNHLDHQEGAR